MTAQDGFINVVSEAEERFVDFDMESLSTFNKVGRKENYLLEIDIALTKYTLET